MQQVARERPMRLDPETQTAGCLQKAHGRVRPLEADEMPTIRHGIDQRTCKRRSRDLAEDGHHQFHLVLTGCDYEQRNCIHCAKQDDGEDQESRFDAAKSQSSKTEPGSPAKTMFCACKDA